MNSLDALNYFLVNYGLYSLVLIVPAALLGILFGWVVWGGYRRTAERARQRALEAERLSQDSELKLGRERDQFKQFRKTIEQGGDAPVVFPVVSEEVERLRAEYEEMEQRLSGALAERDEVESKMRFLIEEREELTRTLKDTGEVEAEGASKSDLKALRKEKKRLEKALATQEKRNAKLEKELQGLGAAKEQLETELSAIEAEAAEQKSDLKGLRAAIEDRGRQLESVEESLGAEQATREQLESALREREAGHKEAMEKLEAIEAEREKLIGQAREIDENLGEVRVARDQFETALRERETESAEAKEKLEALESEREKLLDRAREAEKAVERAGIQVDELKESKAVLQRDLDARRQEGQKTGTELEKLHTEHEVVSSRLAEAEKERDGKIAELATVFGERETLEAEKLALEGQLRDETEERHRLQERHARELGEFRSKQEEFEVQIAALGQERDRVARELGVLNEEKSELENRLLEREAEASAAVAKAAALESDRGHLVAELTSVREEHDEALAVERSKRNREMAEARERREKDLAALREELEQEVSASRSEVTRREQTLHRELGDLESWQQKIAALENIATMSQVERQSIENERDQLRRQLDDKIDELGRAAETLDALRRDHEEESERLGHHDQDAQRWAEELHRLREEKKELHKQLALRMEASASEVLVQQLQAEKQRIDSELQDERQERRQVEEATSILHEEVRELRAELAEAGNLARGREEDGSSRKTSEEHLHRIQAELARTVESRKALVDRVAVLEEELAKAGGDRERLEREANSLRRELSSGVEERIVGNDRRPVRARAPEAGMRSDPELGAIYVKEPNGQDELTKIRGLGRVMKSRLHKIGVYTFRQIADWSDAERDAVGARLSFRDRMVRDDWRGQARELLSAEGGSEGGG